MDYNIKAGKSKLEAFEFRWNGKLRNGEGFLPKQPEIDVKYAQNGEEKRVLDT